MTDSKTKVRLGVSTCLLGQNVRFDGGHKEDHYLTETLAPFVEWIAACPEVDIGLGTPRESIRLIGTTNAPRLFAPKSGVDLTDKMQSYARAKVEQLQQMDLDGYILKKDSPSCGMERVRIYHESGSATRTGVGLFARVLMEGMPELPVEEEGRLHDPSLRANFIVRVFAHRRWRELIANDFSLAALVTFHAQHKFLLMAHSEKHLRLMGKLVAGAKARKPKEVVAEYSKLFFAALREPARTRAHTNVLQHLAGFCKKQLESKDKIELQNVITDFRKGLVPLIVPITLIKHYINKFDLQYLRDQIYLNPHPKELMLLNHV
ncbi:DUF523 and DUF1722 domain-containing protein [candidate division KSB1 bacterium]|nr:DUF523 and DUF1722 domain-containing protein [candidate division KSB1 bacterium]